MKEGDSEKEINVKLISGHEGTCKIENFVSRSHLKWNKYPEIKPSHAERLSLRYFGRVNIISVIMAR